MMRSAGIVVALITSVSSLGACGGAAVTKTASTPVSPKAAQVQTQSASAPLPDHAVRRTAVMNVLGGGLGLFLQKVSLEDHPMMKDGRFHGFRVAALSDPGFWSGVDLRAGDVVTSVNGMPIEHPEEALEAFKALGIASEVRVAYERDGQPRELRYEIVEDEPQKRADASVP
jgi:type II secretory pathway component PulC